MSHTFYTNDNEFELSQEPSEYNFTFSIISENRRRAVVGYTSPDDYDSMNPREEYDNVGTMYCEHGRYSLGDKDAEDIRDEDGNLPKKGYVILPLYLYDHSGITMSTGRFSCPWDSGQVGYIYASRETILKEWGGKSKILTKKIREQAIKYLEGEVETYDQYLTGDVWGVCYDTFINVADSMDDEPEWEIDEDDACWGYFGSEYAEQELKDNMEYYNKIINKPTPFKEDPEQPLLFKEAA